MRTATSSCNQKLPAALVLRATTSAAVASNGGNASRDVGESFTDIGSINFYIDGIPICRKAYPSSFVLKVLHFLTTRLRTSVCRMCEAWCSDVLCPSCVSKHTLKQARCKLCAQPADTEICQGCLHSPPVWTQSAAALSYVSPWRELIIDFKFQSHPALSRFLGKVMAADPQIQQLLAQADCVIPVPLSAVRLRQRGFNQSALLARELSIRLVNEKVLWRLRHTAPQSGLERSARLDNLLHSMAINPSMQNAVRGRRILLVDDVLTTGSTLAVCTQTLLSAGAKQVSCAVLARAAPDSRTQ